jgi:hypothetical protein
VKQIERHIYEVRRLVGFSALIYELTCDGAFTVRFTAPDGRRGRLRMLARRDPSFVAEEVMRHLASTPIPQPAQPGQ